MPMSSQAARARKLALKKAAYRAPAFDEGYLITPHAAIWQGESAREAPVSHMPMRRAVRPLPIKGGRCVALQLREGIAWVAVEREGRWQWKPVDAVLSQAQQKAWAQTGF